jgi:hypothetical protein
MSMLFSSSDQRSVETIEKDQRGQNRVPEAPILPFSTAAATVSSGTHSSAELTRKQLHLCLIRRVFCQG